MTPSKVKYGQRGLKKITVICSDNILLAMNHSCDSLWWQLEVNFNFSPFINDEEREEIYRQQLFCWNQAAVIIFLQLGKVMSLIPLLNSPRLNITVPIPPAKLHHLARKVSKSCYKLREDRAAHHLWTLHWCPEDVMRNIPPLLDGVGIGGGGGRI